MTAKKNNKRIRVHFFLNSAPANQSSFSFKLKALKEIEGVGYAGFLKKEHAIRAINFFVFGKETDLQNFYLKKNKITMILTKTLKKCDKYVADSFTEIFVFPTANKFVLKNMKGVTGFSVWKHSICLFINPLQGWENSLTATIAHEYCHTLSHKHHFWRTILDSIIFEGLAEHFREQVVGGERSPWTKAITEKEAKKVLAVITDKLDLEDEDLKQELFYRDNKFKLWAGYTLGYYIVKKFLSNTKEKNWKSILKKEPKKILELSALKEGKRC